MTETEELESAVRQSKSALRWITLSLFWIIITGIGEIGSFIMFFMHNKNWSTIAFGTAAALLLSLYCKKMSDLADPSGTERRHNK